MSKETCTITIADIYGADWWERNKEKLNQDWEWSFRLVNYSNTYAMLHVDGIVSDYSMEGDAPRIILHHRKPTHGMQADIDALTQPSK